MVQMTLVYKNELFWGKVVNSLLIPRLQSYLGER
jgi:hypothetical protein